MTHVINKKWKKKGKDLVGERVNIGRSSLYGNPFITVEMQRFAGARGIVSEDPVRAYEDWLKGTRYTSVRQAFRQAILNGLPSLKDKVLMCFCKPQPCHGDVLAKMADEL